GLLAFLGPGVTSGARSGFCSAGCAGGEKAVSYDAEGGGVAGLVLVERVVCGPCAEPVPGENHTMPTTNARGKRPAPPSRAPSRERRRNGRCERRIAARCTLVRHSV